MDQAVVSFFEKSNFHGKKRELEMKIESRHEM